MDWISHPTLKTTAVDDLTSWLLKWVVLVGYDMDYVENIWQSLRIPVTQPAFLQYVHVCVKCFGGVYLRRTRTPWRSDWARLGSTVTLRMVGFPPVTQTRFSCSASRNIRSSWLAMTPFSADMATMGVTKDRNAFTCSGRKHRRP